MSQLHQKKSKFKNRYGEILDSCGSECCPDAELKKDIRLLRRFENGWLCVGCIRKKLRQCDTQLWVNRFTHDQKCIICDRKCENGFSGEYFEIVDGKCLTIIPFSQLRKKKYDFSTWFHLSSCRICCIICARTFMSSYIR